MGALSSWDSYVRHRKPSKSKRSRLDTIPWHLRREFFEPNIAYVPAPMQFRCDDFSWEFVVWRNRPKWEGCDPDNSKCGCLSLRHLSHAGGTIQMRLVACRLYTYMWLGKVNSPNGDVAHLSIVQLSQVVDYAASLSVREESILTTSREQAGCLSHWVDRTSVSPWLRPKTGAGRRSVTSQSFRAMEHSRCAFKVVVLQFSSRISVWTLIFSPRKFDLKSVG
ncbi:hypothetical protein GGS20DRAFT_198589 [Poronia punctata]|nr:hypothetical protein GGS20DRAFT_198589 [Poronia punctata]